MQQYVIKRLLLLVPVFLGVSLVIFTLMRALPGDAALMKLGPGESGYSVYGPEIYQQIRHEMGLDRPYWEQYALWMLDMARGNWGRSFITERPVLEELLRRLPVTLELAILTIIVGFIIAIPIGVLSATRQDTLEDYIGRLFAIGGLSIPSFWIGTLLILLPAVWWRYVPPLQYTPPFQDPWQNLQQFIFPAISIGSHTGATLMRMTRSSMLEVLRQDYIRTAWSKGLAERAVIYSHALKNAIIPVVTVAGMQFSTLLGGTVVIESLFGLPGVGNLTIEAIRGRDYPQVQANVLFFASAYVLINLGVDMLYSWLDPRIRYR